MILSFIETPSSNFFWSLLSASIGGFFVFMGIWMEHGIDKSWFSNIKDLRRQERKERWGWRVLMAGIAIEIVVAACAAKDEWEIKQRAAAIEAKIKPRTISKQQIKDFIFLTEFTPKIPVSVYMGVLDDEKFGYATEIRHLLSSADFGIEELPDDWNKMGVRVIPNYVAFPRSVDITNWASVVIICNAENDLPMTKPGKLEIHGLLQITNGFERYVTYSTNKADAFIMIMDAFNKIGISCAWDTDKELVKPGEFKILVSNKPPYPNFK